jgi:hypothetical protein
MKRMIKIKNIGEIFNKSRSSNKLNQYLISFRYVKKIKESSLPKFIKEFDNFQKVPASRIIMNKKNNTILCEKMYNLDD